MWVSSAKQHFYTVDKCTFEVMATLSLGLYRTKCITQQNNVFPSQLEYSILWSEVMD